ncbi:MAG: cell division protein FtsL [Candidatus Margulisbacteria bacterium]|nr:cell division protein FtsL [Candidatus Margulisiibacteriota bacterium]
MRFNFRKAVFILTIFVVLAGIHLYINTQNISLKYEVTDLKTKLSELKSKNRLLGSQVAKKENLPEIEQIAKKKLNMVYPENINYVAATKEATP